jgi:hypothetical protein
MSFTPAGIIFRGGFLVCPEGQTVPGAAIIVPDDIYKEIDSTDAATLCGVSVATIRTWVHRGTLKASRVNDRGRPLFTLLDVAKAEKATRDKARR